MSAAGEETIGTNPCLLSVRIVSGSGKVSEILTIPLGVIQKALKKGENNLWYERKFHLSGYSEKAILNISITTQAQATFSINKVALFFENGRTNVTVKRYSKNLKAYARVSFTGSGLLQGHWEVNGRTFYPLSQYISGQTILLETPDIPSLPTFDPGSHVLRFVITRPEVNIELPALVYFVLLEKEKPTFIMFSLFSPQDKEVIKLPFTFVWEMSLKPSVYLIQFYEKGKKKCIFSAYSKKSQYKLDKRVLNLIFFPNKKYLWKVKSFTRKGIIIGKSKQREFEIKSEEKVNYSATN